HVSRAAPARDSGCPVRRGASGPLWQGGRRHPDLLQRHDRVRASCRNGGGGSPAHAHHGPGAGRVVSEASAGGPHLRASDAWPASTSEEEGTMRELVFALEFKGTAAPVPDSSNRLRAKTFASDQTLRTVLKPDGLQIGIERSGSEAATFESEVEIVGEGVFVESGSIAYGVGGKVTFKTVGQGVLGPSP